MGEARQVLDAVTEAVFKKNLEAMAKLYAADAVAVTPDQGELRGREQCVQYLSQFLDAFPDATYESVYAHESGDTAIDEGYLAGTNTGPLATPDGTSIPATGNRVRLRECDIATVQGGVVTSHRFYFDQMDFLGQLGLVPPAPS